MNTNVNLEAGSGVLAFLAAAFVLGLAVLIFLHAHQKDKGARAGKAGATSLVCLGLYLLRNEHKLPGR